MREIIAILRGIEPSEVLAIAEVLLECGITQLEVPLNSPAPLQSIALLSQHFADHALIGAGTVLTVADVSAVAAAGGRMIISPNANPTVIAHSKALNLLSYPGVFTATECFQALAAGADGLKFFPAAQLGLSGYQALQAVLPKNIRTYAVGGVGADDFAAWRKAGISGFGIGSALYKPQDTAAAVRTKAQALVQAWDAWEG